MPDPNTTFAFIIATLIGATYHLMVGGGARRLILLIVASWAGFAAGNLVGYSFEIRTLAIGDLHLVPAVFGAIFFAVLSHILTTQRGSARSARQR